ncbi:DUF443 family protein [Staphylococcus caprae]|uniref:DUF443 family protein n=1 Tax=Staphylococcus caprae TaxID=29380 RepID=UPI003B228972
MWVIIDNITIETIKKNSKYKLIHYRDSHYIIDLNQNKLTYIFPLLNYVTRKSLVEVKEKDLNDIRLTPISGNYIKTLSLNSY